MRAQLAHFVDLISSRIAAHGSKLRLNPAAAQAIGLALHELATNAGKYGALSTDRGHVDITWGTDEGTFSMDWSECMAAMAERSLGGAVDLNFARAGVSWRLACPIANALEPGNVS